MDRFDLQTSTFINKEKLVKTKRVFMLPILEMATVLATAIAPQHALAATGKDACAFLGMFDQRAKSACEAAAAMVQTPRQGTDQTKASASDSGDQITDESPASTTTQTSKDNGINSSRKQGAVGAAPQANGFRSDKPAGQGSKQTTMPAQTVSIEDQTPEATVTTQVGQDNGASALRRPGVAGPANIPANGPYRSEKFSMLTMLRDFFEKAAHNPQEFAKTQSYIVSQANGANAMAYSLVVPKRNDGQKILTDYDLYKLYHKNPEVLLTKQLQCLEPRDYSAEEACDCLAGFPGDTLIGPGAGELVVASNYTAAIKACGVAADNASSSALKARYLAQRARAQVRTTDPAQGMSSADEAIAGGYNRARIVKAEEPLWELEFLAGMFPPMTQNQFDAEMKTAIENLRTAKKAGVMETYIVATKYKQFLAHVKFNTKVLTPLVDSMMSDPPSNSADVHCGSVAQGTYSDGGTRYVSNCR